MSEVSVLYAGADVGELGELSEQLARRGVSLSTTPDDKGVLLEMQRREFDVVLLDSRLPTMGGMRMLERLSDRWPDVPVIVVSQAANVTDAVNAVKAGAADFVGKPLDAEEVHFAITKAMAGVSTVDDEPPPASTYGVTRIIGSSAALREVLGLAQRAATGNATVLIRGESGTGKELIARRVHEMSPRRAGPFVKVHSAALPDQLLESELFGYEKGAFTGAATRKPGRVELAQGGTLFLDEIGDISPATQVKLLRVLQEREFERLGGTETLKADVRFVAATHKDLEQMVARGEFREDLYYRLNVIPIYAPPLRERVADIPELAEHFCSLISSANERPLTRFDAGGIAALTEYQWPGNVRQLQNFIERLIVLADGTTILHGVVRKELGRLRAAGTSAAPPVAADGSRRVGELSLGVTVVELEEAVRRAEKTALEKALAKANGNRTVAARILGVSRRTLYNKLTEHGLL